MSVLPLNKANFDDAIDTTGINFIDFSADWCAPCKGFGIVFHKVAAQFKDIRFFQVDIDNDHGLAEEFNVMSVPHLVVLKSGVVIFSDSGALPESGLIELVEQAKNCDISSLA